MCSRWRPILRGTFGKIKYEMYCTLGVRSTCYAEAYNFLKSSTNRDFPFIKEVIHAPLQSKAKARKAFDQHSAYAGGPGIAKSRAGYEQCWWDPEDRGNAEPDSQD